jgi:hypothetical protein
VNSRRSFVKMLLAGVALHTAAPASSTMPRSCRDGNVGIGSIVSAEVLGPNLIALTYSGQYSGQLICTRQRAYSLLRCQNGGRVYEHQA